jgi:glycosyltransferase involved in cell wall biosynthesis
MSRGGTRLRVLHVVPWFYPALIYGGPVQSTYDLARATARAGCDVRVLTTNANGESNLPSSSEDSTLIGDGVAVRYCERWFGDSVSPDLLRGLASEIRWADVVHLGLTYSFPVLPTLALCKRYGKPVVWSPHGALQRYQDSRRKVLKAVWEQACRVLRPEAMVLQATSEEEASESGWRMQCEALIVPHGVDVPEGVSHEPGTGALRLMFLGRLHPKKGIENLLDACALLPASFAWSLEVVGAGERKYEQALRAKIEALRLGDRVKMCGLLTGDAKRRAFERADVAVFPSYTENFGMVVPEALAHGVPVISSKGMPWSRVEEVGCGLWVDNDARTIASAIIRMREMDLLGMGTRGREWVKQEFSWNAAAAQMIRVYEEVMARPRRSELRAAEAGGGA